MSKDFSKSDQLDSYIELKARNTVSNETDQLAKDIYVHMNTQSSLFIYDYAASDTSQELGGVLLGHCTEKDGQYRIDVEAAVEARYTEAAKGSVKFTHRSWDYINQVKEEKFPNKTVVGWFHTHPGFGIFLSGYDIFIQQNFFNLPWQVAYVVDPLAGEHGFFGWCNNKIEKVPFYTELNPTKLIQSQDMHKLKEEQKPKSSKSSKSNKAINVIAVIALLVISGYFIWADLQNRHYISYLEETIADLELNLAELENETKVLVSALTKIENEYDQFKQEVGAEEALAPVAVYTIKQGDTLWSISERFMDSGYSHAELARINNILDPNYLEVGEKIFIPIGSNKNLEGVLNEY